MISVLINSIKVEFDVWLGFEFKFCIYLFIFLLSIYNLKTNESFQPSAIQIHKAAPEKGRYHQRNEHNDYRLAVLKRQEQENVCH